MPYLPRFRPNGPCMNSSLGIGQTYTDHQKALFVAGIFLVINLLQSAFTPLLNDESYYWLYAQNLDWGYFDHPPFIAWIIRVSAAGVGGEMGVRWLCILMGSTTIYIWGRTLLSQIGERFNVNLALLLMGGSVFLHLYTFLAIPDTPLLFWESLFFWCYAKYLESDRWPYILALSISTAMLLYAKYHGILVIGFTVLSHPRLLTKRSFYLVFGLALLLFVPHLHWLWEHDFRTIRFQLLERSTPSYGLDHVFNFVAEQLGLTGPVFLLLFSILYKPKNEFQRALKFNVIGIFLFFLLSSFRQRLNTHWTAIAWLPMLTLAYLYMVQQRSWPRYLVPLLVLNVLMALALRTAFVFNWFQLPHFNDKNPRVMAQMIKEEAKGRKVVFVDTYIGPSDYHFYTQDTSFAVNQLSYKRTQFNYWEPYEGAVQGEEVLLVSKTKRNDSSKQIQVPQGKRYYLEGVADFRTYFTQFEVRTEQLAGKLKAGASHRIMYTLQQRLSPEAIHLLQSDAYRLKLYLIHQPTGRYYSVQPPLVFPADQEIFFEFILPEQVGTYKCIFSLHRTGHPYLNGFQSRSYFIELE